MEAEQREEERLLFFNFSSFNIFNLSEDFECSVYTGSGSEVNESVASNELSSLSSLTALIAEESEVRDKVVPGFRSLLRI